MATMFPINALVNAAILLTATPLVFSTDVDMLISPELGALAADADRCVTQVNVSINYSIVLLQQFFAQHVFQPWELPFPASHTLCCKCGDARLSRMVG